MKNVRGDSGNLFHSSLTIHSRTLLLVLAGQSSGVSSGASVNRLQAGPLGRTLWKALPFPVTPIVSWAGLISVVAGSR
jgi:hypothetical protein